MTIALQVIILLSLEYETIMRKFTTTASRRHPDNLDGIRFEKVDSPPGTGLALSFRASFPVVFCTEVTVITVICVSTPHGRRLICRFAKTHIRTCRIICFLL